MIVWIFILLFGSVDIQAEKILSQGNEEIIIPFLTLEKDVHNPVFYEPSQCPDPENDEFEFEKYLAELQDLQFITRQEGNIFSGIVIISPDTKALLPFLLDLPPPSVSI